MLPVSYTHLDVYKRQSSDRAKICADAIIDQNGIRTEFPKEVLAEAEKIRKTKITDKDLKGRLDLRGTSICTIDGADAKDLDDAISVSRTRLGYRLGVHIADVSHYVKAGSAMDREAQEMCIRDRRYNWELAFCELYAGGKYNNASAESYEYSLGLNGLGPVSYTHLC